MNGPIPPERDGHSACVVGQAMYIFGGYEEAQGRFGTEVCRLDLTTMSWRVVNCGGDDPPNMRDFHTATAVGDKMIVFGGRSDTSLGFPAANVASEFYSNKVSYLVSSIS